MKISIIHPSYGRPDLAMKTAKKWLVNSVGIEYILCLCTRDPLVRDYKPLQGIKVIYEERANMVVQMNKAAKEATGDLIVAVSDDFDCPEHWDLLLIEGTKGRKDFVVRIDDGIRNPGIDSKNIIPLPIMDRVFYERVGCIYNPAYNHFYGDQELCSIGNILGKKIELPIFFNHVHHAAGKATKDATNIKNSKFHAQDKATFFKRQDQGFGLQRLSILIPTMYKRAVSFNRLLKNLQDQIKELKAETVVNVLMSIDRGEKSVGEKRNLLVEAATGHYISFIDDDDTVNNKYVSLLLNAIQDKPDCCSLNGIITTNGTDPRVFKHSIEYVGWFEKNNILYRYPNHLNCVKTSIARQIKFPEIRHGEDRDYSDRLKASGLIKTEYKIEETLYYYHFIKNK